MSRVLLAVLAIAMCHWCAFVSAETPDTVAEAPTASRHDEALARSLGADDYGMRRYVLAILRTGPTPLPPGEERNAIFQGHFANMNRLAKEGKLVLAGPLDGVEGRRGIFVLAVSDIEEARRLVATDPVIEKGEMVADLHTYYGSAALMTINELHGKIAKNAM
ncbi:YciI family protein [Xanthomonadaceae bacterium JHOS43]|nr:YciI family protein [Xanthomonadaceae bacterium JHOS43]MCX7563036.1 YciI family protein [Xanthomonadaceae bacterium XH05]